MTSPIREDINDVLDDVIVKINRITDHVSPVPILLPSLTTLVVATGWRK